VIARPAEVLELLRLPRTSLRGALQMLGAAGACTAVLVGYFALFETAGVPMLQLTEEYTEAHWPAWSMFVLISGMPALFEELAFRGVIHCTLERVLSKHEALIIQAALFSIVHLSPVIFLSHFLMGFYFGWLRNQTRSLYPSMLAHACWNAYWVADELWWS
jgi:membrane protease YdiL (CAAX protease family)